MILFAIAVVVLLYPLAAWRAAGVGPGRLWLTAVAGLTAIALGAVLLSAYYVAARPSRLLFYGLALNGPVVLVPAILLSRCAADVLHCEKALPKAFLAAPFGLACGFSIVVFGLGVVRIGSDQGFIVGRSGRASRRRIRRHS